METEPVGGAISLDLSFDAHSAPEKLGFGTSNIIPSRIAMAARKEAMDKKIQQLDIDQIERNTQSLAELDKKEIERIQEFVKAVETHKAWASKSLFSSVISSISSMVIGYSMVTGSFLFAKHVMQGIQLSLCGSLQLFNTGMNYINGWQTTAKYFSGGDKEKEEKILGALPFATNLLILALTTYTFLTIPTDHKTLMDTINQFMAYLNMALGAVEIVTLYKKSVAERNLIDGQNQRFQLSQENELASLEFENHVEISRNTSQEDKKATQQYMQAVSRMAAKTA